MINLKTVLTAANPSLEKVVFVRVYLVNECVVFFEGNPNDAINNDNSL